MRREMEATYSLKFCLANSLFDLDYRCITMFVLMASSQTTTLPVHDTPGSR